MTPRIYHLHPCYVVFPRWWGVMVEMGAVVGVGVVMEVIRRTMR